MSNTLINTNGVAVYLNNDNTSNVYIYINKNANPVYLNTNCSGMFNSCTTLNYNNSVFNLQNFRHDFNDAYVQDMSSTFYSCSNIIGSPICGDNVTNMFNTYVYCYNITGSPVCSPNVTNMVGAFHHCDNLTGSPVCSEKTTNMHYAYSQSGNLNGSPVCGSNVVNFCSTYFECYNLTGNPVCGNNVVNMVSAYERCSNLTGSPVCGPNVTDMGWAYRDCYNLTGNPVGGNKVVSLYTTYWCCYNLTGDMWLNYKGNTNSASVNGWGCFANHNNSKRINIHVPKGYAWDNWIHSNTQLFSYDDDAEKNKVYTNIVLTWTNMTNGYYNTAYNIYVYNNVS